MTSTPSPRSEFEMTAVFEETDGGWVQASIAELPGVITAGPSLEEAQELLLDALREYLLAQGDVHAVEVAERGERHRIAVTVAVDRRPAA